MSTTLDQPDFLGSNFVFWFGVVENRMDPLEIGRCQVRCYGWHTHDRTQIPIEQLPWAHPIVPYGQRATAPPPEGTMVFGFFADGKEGMYPIILGTVPGIPQSLRESTRGFADPYDDAEKANQFFPRKVKEAFTPINNSGVRVKEDVPKRYPGVIGLNEPTVSRLARPTRSFDASGKFLGIVSSSIANTTIDIQRKNRVANIISASSDKYKWNEPFPSFAARYPFNNVTETESGHAFEMDDTPEFERVQLSHRVGSTLEFLPDGEIKMKSMKNKYDITMGNKYEYINGKRDETVQSDMYLRINGELVIQCAGLKISSAGDIDMKGQNVRITGVNNLNLTSGTVAINAPNTLVTGQKKLSLFGSDVNLTAAANMVLTSAMLKESAGYMHLEAIMINTVGIHSFLSPLPAPPDTKDLKNPKSKRAQAPTPSGLFRTQPSPHHPRTNSYGRQETIKTELDAKAAKAQAAAIEAAKKVPATAPTDASTSSTATNTFNISASVDPKTGAITAQTVSVDAANSTTTTNTTTISPAPDTATGKTAGTSATPLTTPDYSTSNTVVKGP